MMHRSGFEPESLAWKAKVLDQTGLPVHESVQPLRRITFKAIHTAHSSERAGVAEPG